MRLSVSLPSPLPGHVLAALLLVALVVLSLLRTLNDPHYGDLDFGAYYRAAARVTAGQTPYRVDEYGPMGSYPYAPAYACLLSPLASLEYLPAARLWLVLNWLALALTVLLAWRLAFGMAAPDKLTLLWATVPLLTYFWANLRVGQVALFMLMACLAWAWARRCGRPFAGGLALAAACAPKLAPGLLVLWLVGRRDWRGLAGVATGAVALALLPVCWFGVDGTIRLHQEWLAQVRDTQVVEQTIRSGNQSLLALLARLPAVSNGHVCHDAENLQRLCQCYPILIAAVGLLLVWRRWPSEVARHFSDETLQLALLLIAMTLLHPRGWRCNFVALLLPCLLLADRLRRRSPGWRVALAVLLLLPLVCVVPTSSVGQDGWTLGAWVLQSKHFWAAVCVAGACVWCHVAGTSPTPSFAAVAGGRMS